jgi:hypothetical protein
MACVVLVAARSVRRRHSGGHDVDLNVPEGRRVWQRASREPGWSASIV